MGPISITGVSILAQFVIASIAWFATYRHNRRRNVLPQNYYWSKFLLLHAVFFCIMSIPHIILYFEPAIFSEAMQIGYVVAHIMVFTATAYLARLVASFTHTFLPHERRIFMIFIGIVVIATIVNTIFAPESTYNATLNITEFNAHPTTSVLTALVTTITYLPLAYFFIRSARRAEGSLKQRPYLLGVGLILLYFSGPMHNYVTTAAAYLVTDIFTTIAFLCITVGVVVVPSDARNVASAESRGAAR